MGTQNRSHTIDGSVNWYYTYNYPNEVYITSDKIDVSEILSSVQARWTPVYSYTNAEVYLRLYFANVLGKRLTYSLGNVSEFENWPKNTTKAVPLTRVDNAAVTENNVLVNTSDYFNSSNPTTRRIQISTGNNGDVTWYDPSPGYWIDGTLSSATLALGDIVLDVPPTATVSAITYDKPFIYAGLTTASITISDVTAYYGGTITDVTFRIGAQSVSAAGDGTLSIALDTAGTFTPTVTVTDSRGQTYTEQLAPITVLTYSAPTVSFTAERTTAAGVPDDEGTYATCPATFIFADAIATAVAPSVVLTDENGTQTTPTVSWYTTRAADGTLSGSVNWNSLASGDTVYASIPGLNTNYSYQISIRPRDSQGTGTAITQTVSSAFYTVDFLAGGHGIAFGKPASNAGFECAMDATFEDTLTAQDMTAQEVQDFVDSLGPHSTPVDGLVPYYKLLWTNPSPNAGFSAQTVLTAEQIAGYDFLEIEVKNYYTGNIRNICKFSKEDPCWLWCFDTSALGTATGYRAITNRRVTIDSNGLSFSTGYNKTSNTNAAGSTGDTLCIPLKIYGIKYI